MQLAQAGSFQKMSFTVKSLRGNTVTVECDGTRERRVGELVHYRSAESVYGMCILCGIEAGVWTDDQELWQRSVVRCL